MVINALPLVTFREKEGKVVKMIQIFKKNCETATEKPLRGPNAYNRNMYILQ